MRKMRKLLVSFQALASEKIVSPGRCLKIYTTTLAFPISIARGFRTRRTANLPQRFSFAWLCFGSLRRGLGSGPTPTFIIHHDGLCGAIIPVFCTELWQRHKCLPGLRYTQVLITLIRQHPINSPIDANEPNMVRILIATGSAYRERLGHWIQKSEYV